MLNASIEGKCLLLVIFAAKFLSHLYLYDDLGPLGRREWVYEEPQKQACLQNLNLSTLTVSSCSFLDQFTCTDGTCISNFQRCDDQVNCDDKSDEENCTVVKLDPDYRQLIP